MHSTHKYNNHSPTKDLKITPKKVSLKTSHHSDTIHTNINPPIHTETKHTRKTSAPIFFSPGTFASRKFSGNKTSQTLSASDHLESRHFRSKSGNYGFHATPEEPANDVNLGTSLHDINDKSQNCIVS